MNSGRCETGTPDASGSLPVDLQQPMGDHLSARLGPTRRPATRSSCDGDPRSTGATAGADLAGVSRYQYPPNVRTIRVMCSGGIPKSFILQAFLEGADGVFVGGCHLGDCHYIAGNQDTLRRTDEIENIIESLGNHPDRFQRKWVSASEGKIFAETITEFTEKLQKLGPIENDYKNVWIFTILGGQILIVFIFAFVISLISGIFSQLEIESLDMVFKLIPKYLNHPLLFATIINWFFELFYRFFLFTIRSHNKTQFLTFEGLEKADEW